MPRFTTAAGREMWELGVQAGWDACLRAKARFQRPAGPGRVIDIRPLLRADPVAAVLEFEREREEGAGL